VKNKKKPWRAGGGRLPKLQFSLFPVAQTGLRA
jgi:hypothetical protein